MNINNITQFKQLLIEEPRLNRYIKLAFATNYEYAAQININTANNVAADCTYDEIISNDFTDEIMFDIKEEELKNFLIKEYGYSIAFIQSGF